MMRAVVTQDRTVVKAGHSVGKIRGLSRLVAWWVAVHPIGQALVVITSDNNDQIRGGIWNELIALQETEAGEKLQATSLWMPSGTPAPATSNW